MVEAPADHLGGKPVVTVLHGLAVPHPAPGLGVVRVTLVEPRDRLCHDEQFVVLSQKTLVIEDLDGERIPAPHRRFLSRG
ncbi:hypothetical protein D3C86_1927680 [compost metagenome]